MILIKNNLCIFCLAISLWFGALNSPVWAQSLSHLKLDANRVLWTHLSFHAKNFWVEVSTDVQLVSMPATEIEALLISTPKGTPVRPVASEASQMTINTTIDPRFRSPVSIYNRIWFNSADAKALGRIRLRRGDDDFKKIYRFTKQGVFRHRIEPKNKQEASLTTGKWTDVKDSFYPYDQARLGCSGVTERSLLIYILSAVPFIQENEPLSLCVFGKRGLHRVTLQKTGTRSAPIDYIEKKWQVEIQKKGHVTATEIAISAEPIESGQPAAENFSFLGFQKDISIHIDPVSHLPIQISGIIPAVGKTHLNLNKVEMKRQAE